MAFEDMDLDDNDFDLEGEDSSDPEDSGNLDRSWAYQNAEDRNAQGHTRDQGNVGESRAPRSCGGGINDITGKSFSPEGVEKRS